MIANTLSYRSLHSEAATARNSVRKPPRNALAAASLHPLFKYIAVLLMSIILFTGFLIMQSTAADTETLPLSAEERLHVVGAGDTIWGIAKQIQPQGADIQHVIYEIKKRNHLVSSQLKSGQIIIIPNVRS